MWIIYKSFSRVFHLFMFWFLCFFVFEVFSLEYFLSFFHTHCFGYLFVSVCVCVYEMGTLSCGLWRYASCRHYVVLGISFCDLHQLLKQEKCGECLITSCSISISLWRALINVQRMQKKRNFLCLMRLADIIIVPTNLCSTVISWAAWNLLYLELTMYIHIHFSDGTTATTMIT